jgi:hypothetical protein
MIAPDAFADRVGCKTPAIDCHRLAKPQVIENKKELTFDKPKIKIYQAVS